jgi:Fe-Mn family superoxide dismutase
MQRFTPHTFATGELDGISNKTIEEHIKLYQGYVKHANLILDHIDELSQDSEKYAYELAELQRRFGFEFDGMRNHEYYFHAFEGGAQALASDSALRAKIEKDFGSFDAWLARFKAIAMTRGIGWAILYYDPQTDTLLNAWVDEQHLGHLTGLTPIVALDMWEHSYLMDYLPSEKKNYIEAFFKNLNWNTIEKNFTK